MNLIGYGLSKFNLDFVREFGFNTKKSFYEYVVNTGISKTIGAVKNRQDLFDGMTQGGQRKGWWQKGVVYKHRKDFIDSQLGDLNVVEYAEIVKLAIEVDLQNFNLTTEDALSTSPLLITKFNRMQETGREAEYYFMNRFEEISEFKTAEISDARLFGDGYDFQLKLDYTYFLAEIKGVRDRQGNIRLTQNEFDKASIYQERYALIVVSNLDNTPNMTPIFNPLNAINFKKYTVKSEQAYFKSGYISW